MPLKLQAPVGVSAKVCRPFVRYGVGRLAARLEEGCELKTDRRFASPRRSWLIAATVLAGIGALASPWSAEASVTFSATAANWRMLSVPQYHQQHGLSCEAAALRMALAAYGINVAEDTLLSQIGADRRAPTSDSSGFHWGDPYASFVGNVDGSERGLTGYGVYYPPIARVAQADGAAVAQAGEGVGPSRFHPAAPAGQPVIAWVSFDWLYHRVTHYVAFDGRTVQFGSPYEHPFAVRGG